MTMIKTYYDVRASHRKNRFIKRFDTKAKAEEYISYVPHWKIVPVHFIYASDGKLDDGRWYQLASLEPIDLSQGGPAATAPLL